MKPSIARDVLSLIPCNLSEFELEGSLLEKIRSHDEYTYLHSLNVARLAVALGTRLGISEQRLIDLAWAALLHDVGKLEVPIGILNKLKKFSKEELHVMQSHPLHALTALSKIDELSLNRVRRLSAAFEHHQRFDLKGYPTVSKSKKLALHPYSRIVAICDTFDAMTTDRIYQRRILPDVALKIMSEGFGTVFDPILLQAFITSMGAFPVGSLVRLSDQRLAIVYRYDESSAIDRPHVLVLPHDSHIRLNLMETAFKDMRIIRSEFAEDHGVDVQAVLRTVQEGAFE